MLTQPSMVQNEMLPLADEEMDDEMGDGYTDGLWLEPVPGVSNLFNVLLHGPTNGTCYLVTSTGFLDPATNCLWQIEGTLQATGDDPTPFALGIAGRTNSLFVRVQACDESCAATNLPLAWQLSFFGVTAVDPAGDWNADGTNNLTHYLSGTDPNLIAFTLSVTNQYTAADSVPVQLNVSGGVPSYMAVLINADASQATWQPFDSTPLSVPTPTNGAYTLTVGLCGLATNATQTWQTLTLYRDNTPLTLALTNLAAFTGSRPYLDPAGYASRSLSSLTWTLVDATGTTNTGNGLLVAQDWSLTDRWHTTNWFQFLDLPLQLGTNSISLQVVDWSGAIATTNFQFVFDTNGDLTPPALTLTWPPDGTHVSGDTFTVAGAVDDDTASVALQYTDPDGSVQTLDGWVERGGNFWVPGVSLAAGTNSLCLLATDAAGNVSTNCFTVVQSSVALTITPPISLYTAYAPVTVSPSDDATSVSVNGIPATFIGFGIWQADNVPLPPGGSVVFRATAQLASGETVQAQLLQDRDPLVFTQTYGYLLDYSNYSWSMNGTDCLSAFHIELQWARGVGGTNKETTVRFAPDGSVVVSNVFLAVWPPDPGYLPSLPAQTWYGEYYNGELLDSFESTLPAPNGGEGLGVEWMEHSTSAGSAPPLNNLTWTEASTRDLRLLTGGQPFRRSQALFDITASLNCETELDTSRDWSVLNRGYAFIPFVSPASPPVAVPPQTITIAALGTLGPDGHLWTVQPDGQEIAATETAPPPSFDGFLDVLKHAPHIQANGVALAPDIAATGAHFCVGQNVPFQLEPPPPGVMATNFQWTLEGTYVNARSNAVPGVTWPTCSTTQYVDSSLLTTNPTTAWWVSGGAGENTDPNTPAVYTASVSYSLLFTNGNPQQQCAAQGQFNMYRPQAKLTTKTGVISLDSNYYEVTNGLLIGNVFALHYGVQTNGSPGILFSNLLTTPTSFNGEVEWVQVINSWLNQVQPNGGSWHITAQVTNCMLDISYPYPGTSTVADDSPGQAVDPPAAYQAISCSQNSTMWLLFKPAVGGHWVPLRKVDWSWSALATTSGGIVSSSNTTNPPSANTLVYPFWTDNAANHRNL